MHICIYSRTPIWTLGLRSQASTTKSIFLIVLIEHMTDQNDAVSSSSSSPTTTTSSWLRGRFIGRGCFGTVSIAVNRSEGKIFAVKSVDLSTRFPGLIESLENEIRILRSLSSPSSSHVVGFIGDDATNEGSASFRNLHLEYMPRGTVADVAGDDLDERLVRCFTWCLVSALRHVHSRGFVHCDVKARNVLLGEYPGSALLADFGSAMETRPGGDGVRILPRGSPLWMAPEVIRQEYQGPESDVWSLGCTVIEMVTGKLPWKCSGVETLRAIGLSDELPSFPSRLSEVGRDFIEKCLRRDRRERWSCDQLLQHQFVARSSLPEMMNSSPRCVLDCVESALEEEEGRESESNLEEGARGRIGKLAKREGATWELGGWLAVRDGNYENPRRGTRRAEKELYEKENRGSGSGCGRIVNRGKMWRMCNVNYRCTCGCWSKGSHICSYDTCLRFYGIRLIIKSGGTYCPLQPQLIAI